MVLCFVSGDALPAGEKVLIGKVLERRIWKVLETGLPFKMGQGDAAKIGNMVHCVGRGVNNLHFTIPFSSLFVGGVSSKVFTFWMREKGFERWEESLGNIVEDFFW